MLATELALLPAACVSLAPADCAEPNAPPTLEERATSSELMLDRADAPAAVEAAELRLAAREENSEAMEDWAPATSWVTEAMREEASEPMEEIMLERRPPVVAVFD